MLNVDIPCETQIVKLIDFLDNKVNYQTPKQYLITEWFSDSEPETYKLQNLQLELENAILFRPAFLDDIEENKNYIKRHIDTIYAPDIEIITFHTIMDAITITLISDTYSGYIRIHY